MKKSYMKPEVNEIEVAANQAVAACAVIISGWQNSWNRQAHGYADEATAKAAHPDAPLFPIYKVTGDTEPYGESGFYWEDQNSNGLYDSGDNIQDGWNHWYELDANGLAKGSVGNITVS